MMTKLLLFLVVLLAISIGIVTQIALSGAKENTKTAYTIVWQVTDYDAKGNGTLVYTETRYVSSSGKWRSVRDYPDGKSEETVAEVGRGVFAKREEKLHYLSGYSPLPLRNAEGFVKSPNYLRTETVLGQLAVVVKPANESDGRFEIFFAPSLNGEIKTVSYGQVTTVKEPVSLTFGQPDPLYSRVPTTCPSITDIIRRCVKLAHSSYREATSQTLPSSFTYF